MKVLVEQVGCHRGTFLTFRGDRAMARRLGAKTLLAHKTGNPEASHRPLQGPSAPREDVDSHTPVDWLGMPL
jgi:hypothetical protein